ncbi:MAG: C1 family peptidase, partial [Rhizobiales bacterium]|nr:C1 family peptidase [Hyphomicrobiales bacterium]
TDAERRPLGAYYRVDARSIADMQAAVHEVSAVYCSARVHEGWLLGRGRYSVTVAQHPLPVISTLTFDDITGGHAFAIVGYTEDGFIIQNSWGLGWGHQGFGLLTYEDWMRNGDDAWVAAMAARARLTSSASEIPASYSQSQMQLSVSMQALKDGAPVVPPGPGGRPRPTSMRWSWAMTASCSGA